MYVDETNQIKRKSEMDNDTKFVLWLCKNGFNGYIALTSAGNTLHPELCLCNPTDKLEPFTEDNVTDLSTLFHFCDGKYSDSYVVYY